jgi:hypothetical protein
MGHLLGNNRMAAVVAGGFFFVLAAVLMHRVEDSLDPRNVMQRAVAAVKS